MSWNAPRSHLHMAASVGFPSTGGHVREPTFGAGTTNQRWPGITTTSPFANTFPTTTPPRASAFRIFVVAASATGMLAHPAVYRSVSLNYSHSFSCSS